MITQYLQSRAMGANERRQPTRRGCVLTTLPRLLQRDLMGRLTAHEHKAHFNVDDLEDGRSLEVLRVKARNRDRWRSGVDVIVGKERMRWIQRSTVKSRKRAAEKTAYEIKKRSEESRSDKRQRTTDQHFR